MWLCAGLLTATVASRIHRAAQPALLYLVPFTLLPLLTMAYLKVPSLSSQTWGGEELRFDMSAVSRATCGVCGPNLSTPSPAALAFWRYDAPLGQQDQRGEDCGSFPFP